MTIKQLLYIIFMVVAIASCGKDKDTPASAAKTTFMFKWTWVYGTNGANNGSESYTLDNANKLSSSVYQNSEIAPVPVTTTYTRNAAGQVIKSQWSSGYRTYEYNASGQLSKSSLYRTSDGTLVNYFVFNYSADGYERVSYSAAGVAGSKVVFTYTTDKKNIAKEVWYYANGSVSNQNDYSYHTTKNPESVYPYSEVYMLDRGFVSKNAISIAASSAPGLPSSNTAHSYTYNDEGYPLTHKETISTGEASATTTYEYIKK